MSERKFSFCVPLELKKTSGDDSEWRVSGLASDETKDLQGEVVRQRGLDLSYLKQGKGLLNNEHLPGPENILGKIDFADVTPKGLIISGYLFKQVPRAQAYVQILNSLKKEDKNRVQLSIEGTIQERGGKDNKIINRAIVKRVALTLDPINPNTYCELVKSLSAVQDKQSSPANISSVNKDADSGSHDSASSLTPPKTIETDKYIITKKALEVGSGYAITLPQDMSGATALTTESLESDKKKKKKTKEEEEKEEKEKAKKAQEDKLDLEREERKDKLKEIITAAKKAYPQMDLNSIVEIAQELYKKKYLNKAQAKTVYPVGTVRNRDGQNYKKFGEGDWRPISSGQKPVAKKPEVPTSVGAKVEPKEDKPTVKEEGKKEELSPTQAPNRPEKKDTQASSYIQHDKKEVKEESSKEIGVGGEENPTSHSDKETKDEVKPESSQESEKTDEKEPQEELPVERMRRASHISSAIHELKGEISIMRRILEGDEHIEPKHLKDAIKLLDRLESDYHSLVEELGLKETENKDK